jgi:flavin reductase (DIM6/NTAB) family NADH-FMN oxidoreductase RutF
MAKVTIGPSTHLFPKPAVLIGAMVEGKANFMTVSWCGIASQSPPHISVAIRNIRHTLKGIEEHGAFSANVPSVALAAQVDYCGIYSGKEVDKSQVFEVFFGGLDTAPLAAECPLNFECKVVDSLDLGSHKLVVGEIVQTHIDEACLTSGKPDVIKLDPLGYASGTMNYHGVGPVVGKAYSIGKQLKPR